MPGLRDVLRRWFSIGFRPAHLETTPQAARPRWKKAATLQTGDGRVLVFDPWYHDPATSDDNHVYDLVLQGPPGPAEVYLELTDSALGASVDGVRILWGDPVNASAKVVGSVGVDSGYLAIARCSDAGAEYRRGGPQSESSLWVPFGAHRPERARCAAGLLMAAGFRLKPTDDELYEFTDPLEDEDIARARAVLQGARSDAVVNVHSPQTVHDISQGLARNAWVALYDETDPFLVAFQPACGDGTYEWSVLQRERQTVGFECRLVEPDEEDEA